MDSEIKILEGKIPVKASQELRIQCGLLVMGVVFARLSISVFILIFKGKGVVS
jgi:hypothetical protein